MSEYPENPGELPVLKLRNRSDGGDGPLRKGSSGELVEQLQMMLRDLGYDIGDPSVDGKFGDLTEKAVRQFQEEHKDWEGNLLKVDGLVGPKTSDAFNRMFVGIWYDKYKTPEEITKDTLYITVTRNALSAEVSLKSNKDTKKVKVIVADLVYEAQRLGIDLTKIDPNILPDARNQRIEFTARIYAFKGGKWVFPGEKRKITFRLKNISREKGVCMNYPRNANQNPDLFFPDDDDRMKDFDLEDDNTAGTACPTEILVPNDNPAHNHHCLKARTKDAVTEATVVVRCEDYGAFGTLEVSAPDCETLLPRERNAEPSGGTGANDVKIPWDDNGNNIADSAPQDAGGAPANSDNDATPAGDGTPGDGLTNYEEYRGFIVSEGGAKKHIRTDINVKDIFIRDRDGLGTGLFNATGLAIHLIPGPDFYNGDSSDNSVGPDAGTQIINFNRGYASGGDQHGLRLVNEHRPGLYGIAEGGGPGTPRVTNRVVIDRAANTAPTEPANRLANTIAHELGHSVNVKHHGDYSQAELNKHIHGGTQADPAGGNTSGDVSCLMRYDNFRTQWCHPAVHPPAAHIHAIPASLGDVVGTTFCSSTAGTGVNNPGGGHFRNDASAGRGNCKSHIKVKDW